MTRTLLMGAALGLATLVSAGSVLAGVTAPPPPPPTQSASSQASDSLSTAASGNVGNSISPRAQACESASKFGDFNGVGIDDRLLVEVGQARGTGIGERRPDTGGDVIE